APGHCKHLCAARLSVQSPAFSLASPAPLVPLPAAPWSSPAPAPTALALFGTSTQRLSDLDTAENVSEPQILIMEPSELPAGSEEVGVELEEPDWLTGGHEYWLEPDPGVWDDDDRG
ncbi:hypothetical protein BDK51DRAFT_30451, partial [Blyttiomyces helicus]